VFLIDIVLSSDRYQLISLSEIRGPPQFDRCTEAGLKPEWAELLRDLDRLQVGVIEKGGRSIQIRTPVTGQVGSVFRAAGVALPPNIGETEAA
jgi:hypothetical protein